MTQITFRSNSTDPLVPLAGRAVRSEIVRENFQVLRSAASLWAFDTVADVTSITRSGGTAIVTQTAHGYSAADRVIITGANESAYNGTFAVASVVDADTYTYVVTGSPSTPATGTITARRKNVVGVTAGSYQITGTSSYTYVGGFSPVLDLNDTITPLDGSATSGVSGDRLIALLTIDASGTLLWTKGNWANPGFPTAPAFPANKVPICQVLVVFDSIVSTATDNSLEITDSLITDVRPVVSAGGGGGGGCSDFACLGSLNADIKPTVGNDNVFDIGSLTQRLNDGFFGGNLTVDTNATVGGTLDAGPTDVTATGVTALEVEQLSDNVAITVTKTDVGGAKVVEINNDGTGFALDVNQNGNGTGLRVAKTNAGGAHVVNITNSGFGDALQINQNADGIAIEVLRTTAGVANVIQVTNSGIGNALEINQYGDGIALEVNQTSAAAVSDLIKVNNSSAGTALHIVQDGGASSLVITQNTLAVAARIAQTTNQNGLLVEKSGLGTSAAIAVDNDGTGAGILVQQDGVGSALNLVQNTNAITLDIDKTATGSANVIDIDQSGSGFEIEGTGNLWNVDNRGHATVSSTRSKVKDALISKIPFSSFRRWEQSNADSVIGSAVGNRKFQTCVFDGRYIYFFPHTAQSIVSYDTTQPFTYLGAWEQIAVTSAATGVRPDNNFSAAIFDGRYVYVAPSHNDTFIRYDTTKFFTETTSWEHIGTDSAQGSGSVVDNAFAAMAFDGRYIYVVPQKTLGGGQVFVRFDTTGSFTDITAWSQMPISSAQGSATVVDFGYGGITFDGQYVYFPSTDSGTFLRYDTTASFTAISSWIQLSTSSAQGAANAGDKYSASVFDGRYVYIAPASSANSFLRFDTTQSFTSIAAWTQIAQSSGIGSNDDISFGATFDGRYVYILTGDGDTHARYDTTRSFTSIASWEQIQASSAQGGVVADVQGTVVIFDGFYVYQCPSDSNSFIRFLANNSAIPSPTEYDQVST